MGASGTGFSLWVFVLACANPRRLKPAPLEPSPHLQQVSGFREFVERHAPALITARLARMQDSVRVLRGDIRAPA